MAPAGKYAPTEHHSNVFKWAHASCFSAAFVLAGGLWAAFNLMPVRDNLKCVVGGYEELRDYASNSTVSGSLPAAQAAADAVSQDTLDNINTGLNNWNRGTFAPGIVTMGLLVLSALTAMLYLKTTSPRLWRYTSKWLVFLTNLLLLLSFVFFAVLLVAGIASTQSRATHAWEDNVEHVCVDNRQEFETQLVQANQSLADARAAGASVSDIARYQLQYDEAANQKGTFEDVCDCVDDTLSKLKPLLWPGIVGLIGVIFGMVAVNALCCTMACCGEPAADGQGLSAGFDQGNELIRHDTPARTSVNL